MEDSKGNLSFEHCYRQCQGVGGAGTCWRVGPWQRMVLGGDGDTEDFGPLISFIQVVIHSYPIWVFHERKKRKKIISKWVSFCSKNV